MADKKITLIIDEKLVDEINERAKKSLRSRNKYIEFLIREMLKKEDELKKETGFLQLQ